MPFSMADSDILPPCNLIVHPSGCDADTVHDINDYPFDGEDAEYSEEPVILSITNVVVVGVANRSHIRNLAVIQYVLYLQEHFHKLFYVPQPLHFSHAGQHLIESFIDGPQTMWLETFRMTSFSFDALMGWLIKNTGFQGSSYIPAREKLFIFLYILCQGITQTAAAYLFGHSNETIYRYVKGPSCVSDTF